MNEQAATTRRSSPWTLGRVEIRSRVSTRFAPIARVELIHARRGRMTGLASHDRPLDAVFSAIEQVIGTSAHVSSMTLDYRPTETRSDAPWPPASRAVVTIGADIDDRTYQGIGRSDDVLVAAALAYLDAVAAKDDAKG